jgi:integrase
MANKAGRRRFGNIRQLPSGRYQVRYPGPDGRVRSHPETFARKGDASRMLTVLEGQLAQGAWADPERARIRLADYAEAWIAQRPGLRPRTVEIYRGSLKRHIVPHLGGVPLGKIDSGMIREWRAEILGTGTSVSEAAKAYRFLRAVLMTAVDDQLIPRNPCRIRGAGTERPEERPVLTVRQVLDLAERMPDDRFGVMVLLAAFASLRWGELCALRRCDLDPVAGTVSVRRQQVELDTGQVIITAPKSAAGVRIVALPSAILSTVRAYLEAGNDQRPDAPLFTGTRGGTLRRSNFRRDVSWSAAVASIGAPGLHFHDLRHTGNTLAAAGGASLRDLMDRMGHDSVRAAMMYQHATAQASRLIADSLSGMIQRDGAGGDPAELNE